MKDKLSIRVLTKLVRMNYKLRERGILPDKWYWADRMLYHTGYYVDMDYRLVSESVRER